MTGLFQKQIMNLKDQQSSWTKMNDNSYKRVSRQIILSLHVSCTVFHKSTNLLNFQLNLIVFPATIERKSGK